MTRKSPAGFTVIELLAALVFLSVAMVGVAAVFATHNRSYVGLDTRLAMETNLRIGVDVVTDAVRDAGYGAPDSDLTSWITWVGGFTTNPSVTLGPPDSISAAVSTPQPVAELSVRADVGTTEITVDDPTQLGTGALGLILIDDDEHALIVAAGGNTLTIDADPTVGGNQGLERTYPAGAPVHRIDVVTFSVGTDATGQPQLMRDEHQGAGPQPTVEGISNMEVTVVAAGEQYMLTLTAKSTATDPRTGTYTYESLESDITVTN